MHVSHCASGSVINMQNIVVLQAVSVVPGFDGIDLATLQAAWYIRAEKYHVQFGQV